MTTTSFMGRTSRPLRREAVTHLYAIGQAVRLKGRFGSFAKTTEIYHITGMLPPREDSPQYRIRNDEERHERVTTQDSLEPVWESPDSENTTLLKRTFGLGQGATPQQSRDPETETGKSVSKK
jgi:hypothetical protein